MAYSMKIYVSHSTDFDYKVELYSTLKQADQNSYRFYFPHEKQDDAIDTRRIIETSDLVLAEVSYPSTGQGIEIAWACDASIPIVCFYRQGAKISTSLKLFCPTIMAYEDSDQMISLLYDVTN